MDSFFHTVLLYSNFFENNIGVKGGSILVENCLYTLLIRNTFRKNSANSGGAIYISTSSL